MDAFERAVLAGTKRLGVERGDAVTVAFSGGPDSTALLAALTALKRFRVSAFHVNHQLRGAESERDEKSAAEVAKKLGVDLQSVRVTVLGRAEDAARKARERAFITAELSTIATGHTLDDQAETVLYRAARGAGARGLRGVLPSRDLAPGVRIIRPMLTARRAEVQAYLHRRKLPFVTDSSNSDDRFARNRIRRDVLPALEAARPGAARHLAGLAREAAGLTDLIDAWAGRTFAMARLEGGLRVRPLKGLPSPVLHAVVGRALPVRHRLSRASREALDRLFGSPPLRIAALGGGWIANLRGDVLRLVGPARPPDPEAELAVPGSCVMARSKMTLVASLKAGTNAREILASRPSAGEVLDADTVAAPLTVGPPRRGERMRPLGAPGSRKIADILTDLGVPRSRRGEELVVRDAKGRAVWLVGRRIADYARVTAETRTALRITCR